MKVEVLVSPSEHTVRTITNLPATLVMAGSSRAAAVLGFDELRRVQAPRGFIESTLLVLRSLAAGEQSSGGAAAVVRVGTGSPATTGGETDGPEPDELRPATEPSVSMEDLIREHSDAVYRVALSVTRDASLAEDVSQDALIKAWTALPTFRGEAPLRNWVLRITHNTAISALRRRREELRDPDELPERESRTSVEAQVQDRLAIDRFEEALAELDSLSRSIIVLREVEGLSYGELCDVLDLPMPTIKTRLLRARRQLAQALEGWQP